MTCKTSCGMDGDCTAPGAYCNMPGPTGTCTAQATSVLIVQGFGDTAIAGYLQGWGYTTNIVPGASLTSTFDYSPYQIVGVPYDATIADTSTLLARNVAGKLGIVCHRCDSLTSAFDLGTSGYWQSGSFAITDNTHFISSPYAVGPVDVVYTYKSILNGPSANVRVLGTATSPSLVVHNTYRRVMTPYYGHTAGMPWSAAGADITHRTYEWAGGMGAQ
jgi:hypothetical protein